MADETDISALRALLEKATPAPWHKRNKVGYVFGPDCVVAVCGDFEDKELLRFNGLRWNADADFCAAARNALPALLSELDQARAERDGLVEACKAAEEWLSGWASAEPYLSVIQNALAKVNRT